MDQCIRVDFEMIISWTDKRLQFKNLDIHGENRQFWKFRNDIWKPDVQVRRS